MTASTSEPRGMTVGRRRLTIEDPRLFVVKSVSVFVLAFMLLPMVAVKDGLPAMLYAGGLVLLHLVILGIYLYRVRFQDLDADRRSLIARLVALAVMTYLLMVVSRFDPDSSMATLALQMLGVSVAHMVVLVLFMVRVHPAE
jgi:hypothetical protein